MKEKGDEKFFTKLEIYGNIKPEIRLQFLISKNLSSRNLVFSQKNPINQKKKLKCTKVKDVVIKRIKKQPKEILENRRKQTRKIQQ